MTHTMIIKTGIITKGAWHIAAYSVVIAVEVQSFGDGKGLTIRMSERVIIRKEFFNITLEERDVSYKVIIQDIR
ncbi:MAG: hypothetical protein J0G32_07195, partial [Alphaproteobacteria bacterium]|nr:hypothetical protein [Alphaproteobacteria bacterium]